VIFRSGLPKMRALRELNTLSAFEMWFKMSSSSEIEEVMIDHRCVKDELYFIHTPSERMIGDVLAVVLSVPLFRIWRTSVFTFFLAVPVCICSPKFLKWVRARFAALAALSRVSRTKVLSST